MATQAEGPKSELRWQLQQMSDMQPVTVPDLPQVIKTKVWLSCEGGVCCPRCCAMSVALASSSTQVHTT
jgi:hypothetical protein